jgi:hypothetical protein
MELFSKIRQAAWLPALLFIVLLLLQSPAYGQATTGNVTGVVSDAKGAVIVNAVVVLTDTLTRTEHKTSSNGHGFFAFASILPSTSYKFVSVPAISSALRILRWQSAQSLHR